MICIYFLLTECLSFSFSYYSLKKPYSSYSFNSIGYLRLIDRHSSFLSFHFFSFSYQHYTESLHLLDIIFPYLIHFCFQLFILLAHYYFDHLLRFLDMGFRVNHEKEAKIEPLQKNYSLKLSIN